MKKLIPIFLFIFSVSVSAGVISRQQDFNAGTSFNSQVNYHGGIGDAQARRWQYYMLSDWDKDNSGDNWRQALEPDRLAEFNQSGSFIFEKSLIGQGNFERYRYSLKDESVYLCWNYNADNPVPDLKPVAIVVQFSPPKQGRYSLSGKLKWASVRGPEMKQAWYVIGKLNASNRFTELYRYEFVADAPFKEPKAFVDLKQVEKLQDIALSKADKLVFVVAGSRLNYRGLEVYDGDLEISSPSIDQVDTSILPLQQALQLLDLARPGLAQIRSYYENGNVKATFEEYKKLLAKRVASFKPIETYSYWLYGPADADKLLDGVLTTTQYGKHVNTTTKIGLPGQVQWYKVPEDGYTTLLRDITTLHWITKLAERYEQTGDVEYLRAWQGYWSDFATNWPAEYQKAKGNPDVMKLVEKNSIAWSDIALYIGWRLENFTQGFNAVAHATEKHGHTDAIDNIKLAQILVHLATFEAARAVGWIERDGGVPNQRVHCATSMFELGVYLNDFKDSARWRQLGIMEVQRSGFLADGTDMEQSLNYNKGLPITISKFLEMAHNMPESEKGPWLEKLKHMYKYRYYYLHAIAKPNGAQPIIGKNNTWRQNGEDEQFMPGLSPAEEAKKIKDFSLLPLSQTIRDYVYKKKSVSPPAFNSIYFPYGGYAILRDGWAPHSLYCFMKTSRAGNGHMREGANGIELSAYGQDLIVNSGGEPYNPDHKQKGFWHSTVAHNSISVDGYGQNLRHNADIPVVYTEPIDARFLSGEHFDFIEGKFRGGYSGWNFKKHGTAAPKIHEIPHDHVIDDVTHDRQIIMLKDEKIWIVTDIIESKSEHTFSQSWLLAPEFEPEMVTFADSHTVTVRRPGAVGMNLHQFGIDQLDYRKYYGVLEDDCVMGWGGKLLDAEKGIFMPAVSLLSEWQGVGKQVLITVIVPYENQNPVQNVKSSKNGFEITLKNKGDVSYNYFGSGPIEARLETANASLILTDRAGYEKTQAGQENPVIIPDKFVWRNDGQGVMPSYRQGM